MTESQADNSGCGHFVRHAVFKKPWFRRDIYLDTPTLAVSGTDPKMYYKTVKCMIVRSDLRSELPQMLLIQNRP
jgi:hypothetical protein